MTEKEVKGVKPLEFDNDEPYDGVINQIRTELGVRMNRSLLSRIALETFMNTNKLPGGKYNLRNIVGPYEKIRLDTETRKLEEKLVVMKRNRDALK